MSRPKASKKNMVGQEANTWRKRQKARRRLENEYGRQRAAFAKQASPEIEQMFREAAGVGPAEEEGKEQDAEQPQD